MRMRKPLSVDDFCGADLDRSATAFREPAAEDLHRRIVAREARIGIIGLGYVGLPLAKAVADVGFIVLGLEIDRPGQLSSMPAGRTSGISRIGRSRRFGKVGGSRPPPSSRGRVSWT